MPMGARSTSDSGLLMAGGSSDQIAYLIQISELIRNFGLVVAAALGLVLAWWRSRASNRQATAALRQAEVVQRDHVVEMFNHAIDQLGSDKLEVRLGAIYTLKRISGDAQYADYRVPILETLTAYVRERSRAYPEDESPTDIREILKFLNEALSERSELG
ncbi:MAG TPA: hypothetical protein VG651_03410 [Stellaceae bacterium]|nr:hypothetical protein [Stellaceae bacterium]